MTRPQIALITRIADSHSAFFASTADIAAAKAEIFQAIEGLSIAVLNRDDAFYETLHAAAIAAGAKQVISFGHHPEAAYRLVSITDHDAGMTIKACLAGTDYVFELRMYGRHLAENAMGVLACVAAAGLPADKAAAALVDCQPPSDVDSAIVASITTVKSALLTTAIMPARRLWPPPLPALPPLRRI